MIVTYGSFGGGITEEINPPETNIECKTCGEKMVLKSVIGFTHSGSHKFIAECPNCKTESGFCDIELWRKCRNEGSRIRQERIRKSYIQMVISYIKLLKFGEK